MIKKVLLIIVALLIMNILGSCTSIPINIAICGNEVCEQDEENICPSDCEAVTITSPVCDDVCSSSEMCIGSWVDDDSSCCAGSCMSEITDIPLASGWNYVSFPHVQINDNIEILFANTVDAYDGSTAFLSVVDRIYSYQDNKWMVWHSDTTIPSDLQTIEAGRGYVFVMTQAFTLSLDDLGDDLTTIMEDEGSSRSPHEITVWTGWNFVGSTYGEDDDHKEKPLLDYFTSVDGLYASLWKTDYDGDLQEISIDNNENLIPTYAYWIYLDSDGEIIP